jgi:hypothetical protein
MFFRAPVLFCSVVMLQVLGLNGVPHLAFAADDRNADTVAAGGQWGLEFDGVDDGVVIDKFRYDGTYPITLEAVVTPTKYIKGMVFDDFEQAGIGLHLYAGETGDRRWKFNVRDMMSYRVASSDAIAELNRTVHLAGVFDGRRVSLFINGKPQARTALLQSQFVPSGLPFCVGTNPRPDGTFNEYFAGRIDALRLSRVVRYQKPFTPPQKFEKDADTLILLNLEEGKDDMATDESGNAYHGKITGAKWVRIEPESRKP